MLRRPGVRPIRRLTAGLSAALLLSAGVAALAPTAQADSSALLTRTSVSWTDSAHPAATRTTGSVQAGTRVDAGGTTHTSRVYVTFDLTSLAGRKVSSAYFFVNGDPTNSCRAIQYLDVRQSATPTAPITWANPPAEGALIGSITPASPICPGTYAEGDASSLIESAVAAGQTSVSLELRVPAAQENDPADLAKLSSGDPVDISVTSDSAPIIDPATLTTEGQACSTGRPTTIATLTPRLEMALSDPDSPTDTEVWAIWPAGQPSQRTVYTYAANHGANFFTLPAGLLTEGPTWSWSVKASDGTLSSPWTAACRFRVDATPPTAPILSSPDIDANGYAPAGQPVHVRITATTPDTTRVAWSWFGTPSGGPVGSHQPGTARIDPATGTVTVAVSPPRSGPQTLTVEALDAANNISYPYATLQLFVPDSQPSLTWVSGVPKAGGTSVFRATPGTGVTDVTAYEWEDLTGSVVSPRVHAQPDGSGRLVITWPDVPGLSESLAVRSISTGGYTSTPTNQLILLDQTPWITTDDYPMSGYPGGGVGVPSTFTVVNRDPGAQSIQYQVDSDPVVTVPLVDGRATIAYTPTTSGLHALGVTPVLKSGPDDNNGWGLQFDVASSAD